MMRTIAALILITAFYLAPVALGVNKKVAKLDMNCMIETTGEEIHRCALIGYYSDDDGPGWKKSFNELVDLTTAQKNKINSLVKDMINKKKQDEGLQGAN